MTHVYRLTKVYGPSVVCEWQEHLVQKDKSKHARFKGWKGARYYVLEGLTIADPETLNLFQLDGEMIGEILMHSNILMKGYIKNFEETEKVFVGG